MKTNESFSRNYQMSNNKQSEIVAELKRHNFKILSFDIDSEFDKCNGCPISVDHMGNKVPYARWVLYNQISRPDLLIRLNKPILLEIKVKNKKFLWVNERDYLDYVTWLDLLGIPIYIAIVILENNGYYIHPVTNDYKLIPSFRTKHYGNMELDLEKNVTFFQQPKDFYTYLATLTN
jgi:hypothetical protein